MKKQFRIMVLQRTPFDLKQGAGLTVLGSVKEYNEESISLIS